MLFRSQVTPRKGVDRLIAAFAGLDAQLVIAGPVRGVPTPAGVRHLDTLEGPERLELLVDADVLAYPSSGEVFGLVPFEGLLCGAPVVVGDDCGCGELVAEAGAGLLVDTTSTEPLRDALRTLLANRDAAGAMVERGRKYIQRHLDFQVVAEAHVRMYAELR